MWGGLLFIKTAWNNLLKNKHLQHTGTHRKHPYQPDQQRRGQLSRRTPLLPTPQFDAYIARDDSSRQRDASSSQRDTSSSPRDASSSQRDDSSSQRDASSSQRDAQHDHEKPRKYHTQHLVESVTLAGREGQALGYNTAPRMWKPGVSCPECHQPNDHDFRHCQMCKYTRKPCPPPRKHIEIDKATIDKWLEEMNKMSKNTNYGKKKTAMENELVDFLGNLSTRKDLTTASPKDVCAFLVWKDKGGKTIVHKMNCKNFGNKRKAECGCPRRLAAGTVDSIIGQLRSTFGFATSGRGGDWNDAICTGNPAAAPLVRQYLKVMKAEQANAMIQPTQAQPVFFDTLTAVCKHIT
ncbi:Hypp6527 [Branchiostoma lanceolatum]|uniref:Hypp6527 protein n=1 Tax=Branchiostoma lanceolatum TaxID=7740 RepID=A0A8K0EAB9_BRALA|nr:Hypp6527 [Branchiostoma lanceolatum]